MEAFEDFEIVEPSPASIVESLRAIGYSLETAIADLIDNSITAGASLICIDSPYNGVDTKLFLLDNGSGMNEETLKNAMKLGSYSPALQRSKKDLGRFGLGLKTASFSQNMMRTVLQSATSLIKSRKRTAK